MNEKIKSTHKKQFATTPFWNFLKCYYINYIQS